MIGDRIDENCARSNGRVPPSRNFNLRGPHWKVAVAAATVHMLHAASVYFAPIVLMSPMRHDLGLTVAQIAIPVNVYRIVNCISLVPVGYELDRIGPVKALRWSIIAAATLGLLYPLSRSLVSLVFLQALFAFTKTFGGLSSMVMVISRAFGSQTGLATAISVLLGGFSLAGFLAPAVVGALYGKFGWQISCLVISGLFAVVGIPLTLVYLGEPPSQQDKESDWSFRSLSHSRSSSWEIASPDFQPSYRILENEQAVNCDEHDREDVQEYSTGLPAEILITRRFLWVMLTVASFSFSLHIILDHLIVFLREDVGVSFESATWYMSLLNLVAFFSKLVVGPLADLYDKDLLMIIFSCVGAASTLILYDHSSESYLPELTTSPVKLLLFVVFCEYIFLRLSFSRPVPTPPNSGMLSLRIVMC